jgi:hypothetical protein
MDLKMAVMATCLTAPIFAQDSTYVRTFNDKLSLQVFVLNASNNFSVDYINENRVVEIIPNQKTTLNIGVQYDIASFSFGFAPKFFAENRDNKGSKMLSFSTTLYPKRVMQFFECYYQKGLSLESDSPEVRIYMPELKSIKIGGSTSFVWNRNFSFRAIGLQNAQQLKSQGSFAPGLSYYYTSLDGRKVPELGERLYFIDIAAEAAYYYNWVFAKHFLLASGISIGGGVSWTVEEDQDYTAALFKGSLMLAPGYNSERWFGGAQFRVHYSGHESQTDVAVGDAIGYITAFVGYRFDAPPFLERQKNKIKNKLKL